MQIQPYLNFKGQCLEAFEYYEKHIGGKILFKMTHGESPMADKMPPEMKDKIMHATLKLGDNVVMGSDAPMQMVGDHSGFAISINLTEVADAERIFGALAEGGSVRMPLTETFWAKRFGMVTDQFGIPWMINCGMEQPS